MPRDIFGCCNWGVATSIWWVEARDSANHSTMHKTAPTGKNYPDQNINSAKIEKSCSTVRTSDVELTNELLNDNREALR